VTAVASGLAGLLAGTVSVVAGAGSGIGQAVAWRLARYGSSVELADVDGAALEATLAKLRAEGHAADGAVVDASQDEKVERFMAGVAGRHDRLDALVNTVGIQRYGTVETTPVSVWDEVMAVNVRSMFLMARHAVPLMRRGGGRRGRQRLVCPGSRQPAERRGLYRQQGSHRRLHPGDGGRPCQREHPRQLRGARIDRHPDAARLGGGPLS
jgi:NAD(P)-dependent dehydrogenase (short-subunit alcohol dehydrogenase family)